MLYLVKSTMPAAKKIQNKFIFLHLNNGRRFYAGSDWLDFIIARAQKNPTKIKLKL